MAIFVKGGGGGGGAADGNDAVKVSANDTTAGFLNGKLVAGANITFTEGSDGGNETLTIAASGGGGGGSSSLTEYTVTTADAENTTSQITIATFTVPGNTWGDGDVVWMEYWFKSLEANSGDSVSVTLSCTGVSDLTSTFFNGTTQQIGYSMPVYKRVGTSLYSFNDATTQGSFGYRPNLNANSISWRETTSFDFASDVTISIKVTHSLADPSNYIRTIHAFAARDTASGFYR